MKFRPPYRFMRSAVADREGTARISSRKIYILPTGHGLAYGVLLILLLLGAVNYANNLGFMLTFLLTGLGLVCMVHTWRNLLGLELTAAAIEPVFAGQPACFRIALQNHRAGPRPGIRTDLEGSRPDITDLDGASTGSLSACVPTERRGECTLPIVRLSTRYPLGLLRAWCYVRLDASCLVYPAPGPRMPPSDVPDYTRSAQGDKGVGADDFVGLRQYRAGDSPKHVSWKALAREQDLQTKMFGGDRSERRWLDLELLSGDLEARLSRLCRGVLDACEQNLEFGLRLKDRVIAPGRGQNQRQRCLEALAKFR